MPSARHRTCHSFPLWTRDFLLPTSHSLGCGHPVGKTHRVTVIADPIPELLADRAGPGANPPQQVEQQLGHADDRPAPHSAPILQLSARPPRVLPHGTTIWRPISSTRLTPVSAILTSSSLRM